MANSVCLSDAFLQQSPGCHCIVDRQFAFARVYGDPSGIFGKTAAELSGRKLSEVLEFEQAGPWRDRFERAFAGETLMLRIRGRATTSQVSVFPLRIENEIRYAGCLGREATLWSKAEQELRNTVLGALKAQEFERNMISKFLHDSIGQNLTAFGLQLDLIRMDLEAAAPEQCRRISDLQKLLEQMMESVREYSYELNPSAVERAGLRSALDRLAGRIRERFAGSLRLNVDPSLKLEKQIATAMYHIAQEAVENAVQHASCSSVEIAVKSSRIGTFLEVRDNGKGFDPSDLRGGSRGLGLLSMEQYAAQAGLELSITSRHGKGTIVRATDMGAV